MSKELAEDSPTKEELIKYGKPRRFILTKYHFGTDPKRVWDINDIAKLMQQYHQSRLQALKEEVNKLKSYPMVYDSYSGEAQMVDKAAVIEIITNLEDK